MFDRCPCVWLYGLYLYQLYQLPPIILVLLSGYDFPGRSHSICSSVMTSIVMLYISHDKWDVAHCLWLASYPFSLLAGPRECQERKTSDSICKDYVPTIFEDYKSIYHFLARRGLLVRRGVYLPQNVKHWRKTQTPHVSSWGAYSECLISSLHHNLTILFSPLKVKSNVFPQHSSSDHLCLLPPSTFIF